MLTLKDAIFNFRFPTIFFAPKGSKKNPKKYEVLIVILQMSHAISMGLQNSKIRFGIGNFWNQTILNYFWNSEKSEFLEVMNSEKCLFMGGAAKTVGGSTATLAACSTANFTMFHYADDPNKLESL